MKPLYSQADVQRWAKQNAKQRQLLVGRLGDDWRTSTDAQGLSMLSLALEDEGYTAFAADRLDDAIKCFQDAVEVMTKLLEMGRQRVDGAEGYVCTGYFQTLLVALAVGDESLTNRFVEVFQVDGIAAEASPPDSTYIARALKALALGQAENAKQFLAPPTPDVDAQFTGYVECLRAIAEGRWVAFVDELRQSAQAWQRFVRKECAGQPQSACFLAGGGFLKLARKLSGQHLTATDVEHIPTLLL